MIRATEEHRKTQIIRATEGHRKTQMILGSSEIAYCVFVGGRRFRVM